MHADLLIRNARTRSPGADAVDIAVQDGRIARIGPGLDVRAATVIDARGRLVTESFVNPHLHLCKAYTLPMASQEALTSYQGGTMGAAMTAIELASRVKERYAEGWIADNARRAVALALRHGNTHIRAFADTDCQGAPRRGQGAAARARRVQGAGRAAGGRLSAGRRGPGPRAERYVQEAMELGADVVGGIPWIEYTEADAREHVDGWSPSRAATTAACPCSSTTRATRGCARSRCWRSGPSREGWAGRVVAHHARAMAALPGAVLPQGGGPRRARPHRRGERPAHGPAPRAGARPALDGRGRRARAGRYCGCLLPVRAQQHARGRVPRGAPAVDDDLADLELLSTWSRRARPRSWGSRTTASPRAAADLVILAAPRLGGDPRSRAAGRRDPRWESRRPGA